MVVVAAIDEDGNYADAAVAVHPDPRPRRAGDRAPNARMPATPHVGRSSNVRVRFSEPVVVTSTDVRVRDARTGRLVSATYRWHADTNTLVVDPVARLGANARYRVEVGSGVVDRGGNHLAPRHWSFTTGS